MLEYIQGDWANKQILKIMGARFLMAREGSYKHTKGKTRMNPVVLDWNWRD